MLYLLWSLLNIGLGIFFITICFRATKLIREHVGLLASIVFVVGLLSFAGNSGSQNNDTERRSNQIKRWTFTSKDNIPPNTIDYKRFTIDETMTLTISLGIQYGRDSTSMKLLPIEATSTLTGFISGYRWKPEVVTVNSTAMTQKIRYEVNGLLEWNLLGVPVYKQFKAYSGTTVMQ